MSEFSTPHDEILRTNEQIAKTHNLLKRLGGLVVTTNVGQSDEIDRSYVKDSEGKTISTLKTGAKDQVTSVEITQEGHHASSFATERATGLRMNGIENLETAEDGSTSGNMWPNPNNHLSKNARPDEAIASLRSEAAAHIWEARGQAIANGTYDVGSGNANVAPVAPTTPETTIAA